MSNNEEVENVEPIQTEQSETPKKNTTNFIILGVTGCGKSTVGWLLAKLLGYGIVDVDTEIEKREKKPIFKIFDESGEAHFRDVEKRVVKELGSIKNHVISVGGGAVIDSDNWEKLRALGTTIWLNTPPDEISRRILSDLEGLKQRPFFKDLVEAEDLELRRKMIIERLVALIGQRQARYAEADVILEDSYSIPESTALKLRALLVSEGILEASKDGSSYDRWHIL